MTQLRSILPLLGTLILAACDRTPPVAITRIQAYRCSRVERLTCRDFARGEAISRDSLPPADQAFQLWAWHPGKARIVFRTAWASPLFSGAGPAPKQSESEFPGAADSTMLSFSFVLAARTRYVVHVLATTPKGRVMSQDSVVWDYTGFPPPDTASEGHHH